MYSSLPGSYSAAKPILERILQENAGAVIQVIGGRKRPDPPRSLIAQAGSLEALITWNSPQKDSDIVGWRVYKDNESNLLQAITDAVTRKIVVKLPSNTPTGIYVSSVNARGKESIKVFCLATANTDQYVVTGTGGATGGSSASPPPGYTDEPSGGHTKSGRVEF